MTLHLLGLGMTRCWLEWISSEF